MSCQPGKKEDDKGIHLITLDPGHFHAALIQKTVYNNVDSVVHVYAPEGNDLRLHEGRINAYNIRSEAPTNWKEVIYTGNDFFERMLAEKKGNVVVLAGNNQKKTEYISKSLESGFNVLADKPMVINSAGFETLKEAFETARQNNLLLYDIMTERFEITSVLQRELSMISEIFGELEKGTPENPAITKESVHHFYKYVSGNVLTRPPWFMDVSQQGEGIVDVMTHLVDLVQWECFPGLAIDYTKDIAITSSKRWTTDMNLMEFKAITKLDSFPTYLTKNIMHDTMLQVYCNGEINYQLRGIHAKTSVIWKYKAPEGTGDTHYSIMRGTKANLIIRQGAEENYQPTLYIVSAEKSNALTQAFKKIQASYPGVELKEAAKVSQEQPGLVNWRVVVPEKYRDGHESHFAKVTGNYLEYFKNHNMPSWEVPNMLAKYYTTTRALEISLKTKQ